MKEIGAVGPEYRQSWKPLVDRADPHEREDPFRVCLEMYDPALVVEEREAEEARTCGFKETA